MKTGILSKMMVGLVVFILAATSCLFSQEPPYIWKKTAIIYDTNYSRSYAKLDFNSVSDSANIFWTNFFTDNGSSFLTLDGKLSFALIDTTTGNFVGDVQRISFGLGMLYPSTMLRHSGEGVDTLDYMLADRMYYNSMLFYRGTVPILLYADSIKLTRDYPENYQGDKTTGNTRIHFGNYDFNALYRTPDGQLMATDFTLPTNSFSRNLRPMDSAIFFIKRVQTVDTFKIIDTLCAENLFSGIDLDTAVIVGTNEKLDPSECNISIIDGFLNIDDTLSVLVTAVVTPIIKSKPTNTQVRKFLFTFFNRVTGKITSKLITKVGTLPYCDLQSAQYNPITKTIMTISAGERYNEIAMSEFALDGRHVSGVYAISLFGNLASPITKEYNNINDMTRAFYIHSTGPELVSEGNDSMGPNYKMYDIYVYGSNAKGGDINHYTPYIAKYTAYSNYDKMNPALQWEYEWSPEPGRRAFVKDVLVRNNSVYIHVENQGALSTESILYKLGDDTSSIPDSPTATVSNPLSVFPNPTDDNITLSFMARATENYILTIYNTAGEVAYECEYFAPEGENTLSLDLSGINLTNGAYYIKLVSPNATLNSNFVVKRN